MELGEKYAYTVYQTKSFSKAAQGHYVTQSALSSTVKKLEEKLGFNIFDRSKSPVCLTKEGEIYIDYLEEIIDIENSLIQRINSLHNQDRVTEKLAIGGTSMLAYNLLPKTCAEFHPKFPTVEVMLDIGETTPYTTMFDKLDSKALQLMIGYSCDNTRYSSVPLLRERYVIAVKRDLCTSLELIPYALTQIEILSGKDFPDKEISDYSLFKDIKFQRVSQSGIIWRDMSEFLCKCSFSSCYACKTRKNDIAYNMMLYGLGAVVTTDYVISTFRQSDDVLFFLVKTPISTRHAMFIYKKDEELSEAAKEFISIARRIAQFKK